jgi:hypothetical protein
MVLIGDTALDWSDEMVAERDHNTVPATAQRASRFDRNGEQDSEAGP